MYNIWDRPVRGERYSIVTKRRLLEQFMEDPTEDSLKRMARSLWAYDTWATVDFPVEERMLGEGHTATEFRDFLEGVQAGEKSTRQEVTPTLGTWVMSELLEAMDPERYATLNSDARDGLAVLGYPTPGKPMQDNQAYWEFVDNTKDAVEQFALRARVEDALDEVPDDVPTVDVAQVAFQLHTDDEFAFDLGTLREEA
jgi:hypothetical protein